MRLSYRAHLALVILTGYFLLPISARAQSISYFTPTSGPVGTLITVVGSQLESTTAADVGGVSAVIVNKTASAIQLMLMPGATSGPLSLTTPSGVRGGGATFHVTPTRIPREQLAVRLNTTQAQDFAGLGWSIGISADGNTAILGAPFDNGGYANAVGAAFIFVRVGNSWMQQAKLVGTGYARGRALPDSGGGNPSMSIKPLQGLSVAISADGNTALVGGPRDSSQRGAVWAFVRNGSTWTQQGPKLMPSDPLGSIIWFGHSLALSADGNVALIGGPDDRDSYGAGWIFARSAGRWTQQAKLVRTENDQASDFGCSVALSADGKTALLGGYGDDLGKGAAWVFTSTPSGWVQQGPKLQGNDLGPSSFLGWSVALSADGNTALVGGWSDFNVVNGTNKQNGAAWIFVRANGAWEQQGPKLIGTGVEGPLAAQGYSVALSADGTVAVIGAPGDNFDQGALWVFTRLSGAWTQEGEKMRGDGTQGGFVRLGHAVVIVPTGAALFAAAGSGPGGVSTLVFEADPVTTSLEQPKADRYFSSYTVGPNPSQGDLKVWLTARERFTARFELVNVTGQVLLTQTEAIYAGENAPINFRLGSMAPGLYLLRTVNTNSGETVRADGIVRQ